MDIAIKPSACLDKTALVMLRIRPGDRGRAGPSAAALAALAAIAVFGIGEPTPAYAESAAPGTATSDTATSDTAAPDTATSDTGTSDTGTHETGTPDTADTTEFGTFTFQLENDKFTNADRHYTNGVRAAWVSPRLREQAPWIGDALDWIYPFEVGADARIGVHLGQSMFTPDDISERQLISDDRPYAGWLYTGASLHVEARDRILSRGVDTLDTLEVDIGMVGPASLAEQSQKIVHQITGAEDPKGWSHQLNNEPGIILTLQRKWRPEAHDFGVFGLEGDFIPSAAASVGNIYTAANIGGLLRFGQGLEVDYGPPLIAPNISGVSFLDRVPAGYAWYVFGGVGGRFVARDIFLDGNTFSHSHSVDKKLLVGNAQAGVAVVVRGVRIAYTQVWLTKEFDGQKEPDAFGSLSLSLQF